jgi:hypothetical protein
MRGIGANLKANSDEVVIEGMKATKGAGDAPAPGGRAAAGYHHWIGEPAIGCGLAREISPFRRA